MAKQKSNGKNMKHPYMALSNWMSGGSCVFWSDKPAHLQAMYNNQIAEEVQREKNLFNLQQNV